MNCAGQSKTIDTLCFPAEVLKKVLVAAEQKKGLEVQVVFLNERITGLQQVIKNLNEKDSASILLYNNQLQVMKDQKALYQDQLNGYEKIIRREKRKRFWTGFAGAATTITATYLFITK